MFVSDTLLELLRMLSCLILWSRYYYLISQIRKLRQAAVKAHGHQLAESFSPLDAALFAGHGNMDNKGLLEIF